MMLTSAIWLGYSVRTEFKTSKRSGNRARQSCGFFTSGHLAGRGRKHNTRKGNTVHRLRSGLNLPAASIFAAVNPLRPERIMTNTQVVPFSFNSNEVRTVVIDGKPWFVAADVCAALGYQNTSKAIGDHLDADERASASVPTPNAPLGVPTNIINESGLYALVLRSRKPEARKFAKWVTAEVLPAIRKTGSYTKVSRDDMEISAATLAITSVATMFGDLVESLIDKGYRAKGRWMIHYAGEQLGITPVAPDAYIGTLTELASSIEAPDFATGKTGYADLAHLAKAINGRLAKHLTAMRVAKS